MNKFKTSAIAILQETKTPLHSKEITRLAIEKGLLETEGATPEASMNAQLTVDINQNKEKSDFVKTAPSTFGLNPNKVIEVIQEQDGEIAQEDEKIRVESGYIGKGGEYLVCSELLFRGYNASIMSVDIGIDISAIKDNKFYGIQVKSARKNKIDTYNFHIRRSSFEKHNQGNIFYILVLRDDETTSYLILPAHEIERKIEENAIFSVNENTGYALSVKIRDGKIYLGNMNYEMSYYLNNWKVLK
ncbi:MAG: hypothetical protein UT66_C0045G0003 [candidate division CPR2 bacterium GW2011_GWC1_39_9]|nr:MAG: hypothetical protein UT66_C0045G0003 [candidate division CPR2 bacterium GW2011_GWC1_39_9]